MSLAQTAERGKFDLMFLADALAVRDAPMEVLSRWPQYTVYFEPLTLLSGIAVATKHLGLVATASTSYSAPYNIARAYASLDHISGGRAGWNVVTSGGASVAANFNKQQFAHDERYERATEFAEVVRGLWDSWDDDAFMRDRTTSRYFDPAKVHALAHEGKFFSVKGLERRPGRRRAIRFSPGRRLASRARTCGASVRGGVHAPAYT